MHHNVINALSLLVAYGMDAALPLLAIAYGGQALARGLSALHRRTSSP
ncbi:hypothetical protein H6F76_17575 [Leptolyngbya sp. FACHB-321]|nr:hypothetical protein [Leptolyngbya sp. FACHB-321]MBD2036821.1 hypothetical protein [Leptolyngbya sp. FACHB-321]